MFGDYLWTNKWALFCSSMRSRSLLERFADFAFLIIEHSLHSVNEDLCSKMILKNDYMSIKEGNAQTHDLQFKISNFNSHNLHIFNIILSYNHIKRLRFDQLMSVFKS